MRSTSTLQPSMRITFITLLLLTSALAKAQPLTNPYDFFMGPNMEMDTGLVVGSWDGPDPDRITVKDGHFVYPDGRPFRMVGTTIQYGGCFPDSAAAIAIASRLRALGINTVRFTGFDYPHYTPISILAEGTSTTENGLHPFQMALFDWFTFQLRQRGIRYGFSFQSAWVPRPNDGVRQPDSTGFGARMTVIFDPVIQRIHRDVIRLLLSHVNPHTGLAYKDDPGLMFVMPLDDSPLTAYWLYTKDIVENNPNGNRSIGLQHQRWMDTLFYQYLASKGLANDAALRSAWSITPTNPVQQIRNSGFEDPFDPAWTLNVNTTNGGQAILQYTESDKVSGQQAGRVRIGRLPTPVSDGTINLLQTLGSVQRLHKYRLSLHMKTSSTKGTRRVRLIIYNNGYPYNSYGLNTEVTISATWAKYQYEFLASSLDAGTAALQIQMGGDTGDVYLDDVTFTEIGADGLRPGESIMNGTLKRDVFWDPNTTPARFKANADFYRNTFEKMLTADLRLIRDTLKSQTLLVPSSRTYFRLDHQAAMNYDFFSSTDWRNSRTSMLSEQYGGTLAAHAQNKYDTKPLVLCFVGIAYPLPYQHEEGIIMPAYAGLQNWDGVFFSVFNEQPRAGSNKVDSLGVWTIYDKPNVLTQLPAASNLIRRRDVVESEKVVSINNNQETLDFFQFHPNPYSLSVFTDSRLPLYRRVEIREALQPEESITPHREVSALSGTTVDPTTMDGENGQIFFDASRGVLRTISPNYICIAGRLQGQIVSEENIIVEQTSGTANSAVTISSLTDKPVLESSRNLLVIGGRGLNAGSVLAADGTLSSWGQGPFQLEGSSLRITLRAPQFDSCRVLPLGSDARPINRGVVVAKSQTGRFSLAINTATDQTPWYRVEFFNVATGIDEDGGGTIVVAPNPVSDRLFIRSDGVIRSSLLDMFGAPVVVGEGADGMMLDVSHVASGTYVLETFCNGTRNVQKVHVVH